MNIIAIEGLSGVGKSTLAPIVARELGAERFDAIPRDLEYHRIFADSSDDPTYRHLFYLWALATSCRRTLEVAGDKLWLVESYIGRTTAYHVGMGSTLKVDPWSMVPRPALSVMITCGERVRRERIACRPHSSYWRQRSEEVIEQIRDAYEPFADVKVSNEQKSPGFNARRIAEIVTNTLADRSNK